MRTTICSTIAVLALLFASSAMAKPTFLTHVPNGSMNSCNTCHGSAVTPVTWNAFGDDVLETLVADLPDWSAVCAMDSDGDGASNGAELGDPDCTWEFGDSDPEGDVFNPGDETSAPEAAPEPDAGAPEPSDTGDGGADDAGPVEEDSGSTDTPDDVGGGSGGTGGSGSTDSGGGCNGGSTAPMTGLALLLGLAAITRRRVV